MSVFRNMTTNLKDKACLETGLKSLGYNPVSTGQKQQVRGHGSEKLMADIVLKKEDTKLKGDIGFDLQKDGTYSLVFDTYVVPLSQKTLTSQVSTAYNKAFIKKKMSQMEGYEMVQNTDKNGEVTIVYRQVMA